MVGALLLGAGKWVLELVKSIPFIAYVIVGLIVGGFAWGEHKEKQGKAEIQAAWDKSTERGRAIVARLEEQANAVTTVVEKEIVYRDRVITEKGQDRVVVQKVFVPPDSGNLSGGFRVFHDAAATDTVPDPAAIVEAAPTPIADVAATLNANYTLCHKAYARVEAWEKWAAEQARISEEAVNAAKENL